ncbi:hypothetical protein, partial [Escherichia coli]|uniref:hypothetical protein n=1 Tax=Escherichia coli TaxID=562 RepID=UPI00359457CD
RHPGLDTGRASCRVIRPSTRVQAVVVQCIALAGVPGPCFVLRWPWKMACSPPEQQEQQQGT